MNKSFKVVFSKARSALMVVNEATSSIQAKGTKTVIAAAAAAMLAGGAVAATTDATLVITSAEQINPPTTTAGQKHLKNGQVFQDLTIATPTTTGNYGALYVNGVSGANGVVTVSGLKFLNNTTYTKAAEGENKALYGQGGAAAVYRSKIRFEDAQFTGNTAQGHGGALLIATGAQPYNNCTVEVAVTANKKAVYAGNKAGSAYTQYEDMGGFAFLRDGSTLTLDVAQGSFLTIGEAGAAQTAGLDSIASVGDVGEKLNVTGGGSVTINGSTENFAGTITVASGSSLTMATGFGSRVTRQQIEANRTSGSDSATAAAKSDLKLASVLEVASGASATINDVLEITGQTAATSQEDNTNYQQAGNVVKVANGGAFVVDGIKVTSHTYADKLAATGETLGVGVKTVGRGLIDVEASGSAIVKNDVTVDGNTMIKAGEGELKVNGAVVTAAAVKSGSSGETPAGIFNIQAGQVTAAKITNAGTTNVASGAALALTGTGSVNSGTISIAGTTGTAQGTNTKAGSLTVAKGADFVNTGFISGKANKAENNKTTYTADNAGDVIVAGTFTNYGTVDGKTVNGYIGANSLTVEEGGVLNTKITDSYAVAKTTVKGTFNLTELNSSVSGKATDPKDQLVLAGEMTLDGGLVTLNGQEFTGNVQLGLSNGKPDATDATVAAATVFVKGARDYKASQITFRPKGQSQGKDSTLTLEEGYEGTYTVGTLDAVGAGSVNVNGGTLNVDTKLTTNVKDNTANVHVGKDGTLALTKTAIGLTVATSGKTETFAVADTFKGVQNAGRVLVTGLDGMTVKAATLTGIKNAIVKNADSTGFIDFGKLAVDATTLSGYNSTANTLTASGAAILDGMHLDQFKNTTVTEVSGASNALNGSFGAVKLTDAATQNAAAKFAVAANKQVYLNNSGNLVVDKDGKLADVFVGTGSSFVTTGQNAVVGGVTGESGSNFVVESGSLEAKGNVSVADLTVTGALTVNEKAAVPASDSTAAQPAKKYTRM